MEQAEIMRLLSCVAELDGDHAVAAEQICHMLGELAPEARRWLMLHAVSAVPNVLEETWVVELAGHMVTLSRSPETGRWTWKAWDV
jgi:hypothetical protein